MTTTRLPAEDWSEGSYLSYFESLLDTRSLFYTRCMLRKSIEEKTKERGRRPSSKFVLYPLHETNWSHSGEGTFQQ